jgi:4-deoxy-L-threo-5-hexosulose-uronate ketol-isomerase
VEVRYTYNPDYYKNMNSDELRKNFLIETLFEDGKLTLIYTDVDRSIIGSAIPVNNELALTGSKKETASEFFLERREAGIINIGAKGSVILDGKNISWITKTVFILVKEQRKSSLRVMIIQSPQGSILQVILLIKNTL